MRLEAKAVSVRYPGAPAEAVHRVDLAVQPGTLHAVLGPNGSGKSTLMRAMAGVLPLADGAVELDGRPLDGWDRRERARVVGAVPQSESIPFPITARELAAMGRYPHLGSFRAEGDADRHAIDDALERCDVGHLAGRLVQTLSGGELQRVRIARALAQEPRILLLDEPTASLDVGHEMAVLELLRGAADAGIAVLWVTHHLDVAGRFADRMTILSCGRVVANGTPHQVLRPDVLEQVYQWPVRVEHDPEGGAPRVIPIRRHATPTDQAAGTGPYQSGVLPSTASE